MSVSIAQLSFEHHRVPFGIGESKPRISWRFGGDASNWTQTSYDLQIHKNGAGSTYSSAFSKTSSDSLYVPWPDSPLGSMESVRVRARASRKGCDADSSPTANTSKGKTKKCSRMKSLDTRPKRNLLGIVRRKLLRLLRNLHLQLRVANKVG